MLKVGVGIVELAKFDNVVCEERWGEGVIGGCSSVVSCVNPQYALTHTYSMQTPQVVGWICWPAATQALKH